MSIGTQKVTWNLQHIRFEDIDNGRFTGDCKMTCDFTHRCKPPKITFYDNQNTPHEFKSIGKMKQQELGDYIVHLQFYVKKIIDNEIAFWQVDIIYQEDKVHSEDTQLWQLFTFTAKDHGHDDDHDHSADLQLASHSSGSGGGYSNAQ